MVLCKAVKLKGYISGMLWFSRTFRKGCRIRFPVLILPGRGWGCPLSDKLSQDEIDVMLGGLRAGGNTNGLDGDPQKISR